MARDIYVTAAKLKALAESPNEHEAARAREKYEDYVARHQIVSLWPEWEDLLLLVADTTEASRARTLRVAMAARASRGSPGEAVRQMVECLRHCTQAQQDAFLRRQSPAQRAYYRLELQRRGPRLKRRRAEGGA
jgi:hypothetical protein